MANQPIIKKRYGRNSIAIFRDEKVTDSGEIRTSCSCSVQRSYKDKNGEWKETTLNCFVEDLLPLSTMLGKAILICKSFLKTSLLIKQLKKLMSRLKQWPLKTLLMMIFHFKVEL